MCGIAGLLTAGPVDEDLLRRMGAAIAYRGPDDAGVWSDGEAGVGFAHRRLSIVDLSPQGHQPMLSADGRLVLNYNGEIYNHAQLRRELEDRGLAPDGGWRGHSDTETLVQAISALGLEDAIGKCVGMFAIALWDRKTRTLRLVRDRFGEKPLYYGWIDRDFVFASELKALRAHPDFEPQIDRRALQLFAARTHVPAPFSIYRRIFKLEPASILTMRPGAEPSDEPPVEAITRYWSYREVLSRGMRDPIADEGAAIEGLDEALSAAVRSQLMADVPVGAFLSGGIDSSTVVALCQRQSSQPVKTFSIAFGEAGFNEAEDAKAVAAHLGTDHNEHLVTVREAREVIPLLSSIYDEPFADSSQIPTYLISRFARGSVTVALTGDGGDELLGGYNRHVHTPRLWQWLRRVPQPARRLAGASLGRLPPSLWQGAARILTRRPAPNLGARVQQALTLGSRARRFDDIYVALRDEWEARGPVIAPSHRELGFDLDAGPEAPDAQRIMYADAVSYLPDDVLAKVDRASMSVSLETRVPFLDHRVAEVAARIPLDLKIRGSTGKVVLRKLLYRDVPQSLLDRPKAGFAVPVGEWIRAPLRDWAEHLLDPKRLRAEGWFDVDMVRNRWTEHLRGRRDSTMALWSVLMFQAWLDSQKDPVQLAA